jgi:hypothetical protein
MKSNPNSKTAFMEPPDVPKVDGLSPSRPMANGSTSSERGSLSPLAVPEAAMKEFCQKHHLSLGSEMAGWLVLGSIELGTILCLPGELLTGWAMQQAAVEEEGMKMTFFFKDGGAYQIALPLELREEQSLLVSTFLAGMATRFPWPVAVRREPV